MVVLSSFFFMMLAVAIRYDTYVELIRTTGKGLFTRNLKKASFFRSLKEGPRRPIYHSSSSSLQNRKKKKYYYLVVHFFFSRRRNASHCNTLKKEEKKKRE